MSISLHICQFHAKSRNVHVQTKAGKNLLQLINLFRDVDGLKVEDNPTNVGGTTKSLYLHIDMPYMRAPPDVSSFDP